MLQSRFRAFLLAGLLPAHTIAQPLSVDSGTHSTSVAIRVFGGGECIRRPEVTRAVEAWLGMDALPSTWTVIVLVRTDGIQFSIYESGKLLALRRFEGPPQNCGDFEAALGASIGLSLEALSARRAEQEEQAALEELVAEEEARREEDEGSPISITGQMTFASDTLIGRARGGHVTLELGTPMAPARTSDWRLRFGVMSLWGEDVPLANVEGSHLSMRLLAVHTAGCWGRGRRAWRLQACTDVLVGHVTGLGVGDLRGLSSRLPWAAWGAGVEGRWWVLEPVALSAGAQGNVHLVRPSFRVVAESGRDVAVYRLPALGFMFHVGATWSYR